MSRGADRGRRAYPDEILGARGISELLGLAQRTSVYTLKSRYSQPDTPDELRWPEPWKQEGTCMFWHRDEIVAWEIRRRTRRRRGRRASADDAAAS